MRRIEWLIGLGVLLALSVPAQAFAEDAVRYREEMRAYSQRADELSKHAQGSQVSAEMKQVKAWLDEALVQVGKEKFNAVKTLVQRAKVQVEWAETQLILLDKRAAANAREEELLKARQALSVAKAEMEELKKFEAQLQDTITTKSKP